LSFLTAESSASATSHHDSVMLIAYVRNRTDDLRRLRSGLERNGFDGAIELRLDLQLHGCLLLEGYDEGFQCGHACSERHRGLVPICQTGLSRGAQ